MKKNPGFNSMSFQQIMRQQALQGSTKVYCRFCGMDVTTPSSKQPEMNWNQNLDWEQANRAHVSCARQDYIQKNGGNNP